MKNIILSTLALVALASCSKNDDFEGGKALPYGEYPMELSAEVEGLSVTRASGKDAWVQDDEVAVKIDAAAAINYTVSNPSSGTLTPPTGSETYWSSTTETKDIVAWYPAEDKSNVSIADQSGGFAEFDYLKASLDDYSYNQQKQGGTPLTFTHQMAKVKVELSKGDGVTDADINSATVRIYGNTVANWASGALTSSTPEWITTTSDREALLPATTHTGGNAFIFVTMGSTIYAYTPTTNLTHTAGKLHTYNIKVNKTELTLTSTNISGFTDGGSNSGDAELFTYALGDLYPKYGTPIGVVYKISNDGANGMVVSLYESTNLRWEKQSYSPTLTNANNTTNGLENMATVVGRVTDPAFNATNFPAIAWVNKQNTDADIDTKDYADNTTDVWYLPSKDELLELYVAKTATAAINTTLTSNGTALLDNYYWSSTENGLHNVWVVYFSNGETRSGSKMGGGWARAILAF